MKAQKLAAIDDLTSPLCRIMAIHNDDEPARRQYDVNVSAFSIGNGYLLSVTHVLKTEMTLFRSMREEEFHRVILPGLHPKEVEQFNQWFVVDKQTRKRYLQTTNQNEIQQLVECLKRINYDTRVATLYANRICKPYLIIQQRAPEFYNNHAAHRQFKNGFAIMDPNSQRQTYLVELELVATFATDDIALYKIVNTDERIVRLIPSLEIDPEIYDETTNDLFCLQSAPSDLTPGRMINKASIEGLIDQWNTQPDRIGGNYIFEGLRYLIKGYFRFGSSGAPYIKFHQETGSFKVNAIQSEACPIQLTIKNDRTGNFQWINAVATPLANIAGTLKDYIGK